MGSLFKKIAILSLILFSCTFIEVKAETYYINKNGVEMTQSEYEKIVQMFSEIRVEVITQEEFNQFINGRVLSSEILYYKVRSNKNGIISEEYITEDEYERAPEAEYLCENAKKEDNTRSDDYGYIETTYKRFSATLSDYTTEFVLSGTLSWKRMPACRSYDVFAFRLDHMSYSDVYGGQTYFIGNNYTNISYNSSSQGYKSATNGAGFSMNLKDGTNITRIELSLIAFLNISDFNSSTAHVYTTYQHAIATLSRADSMSYTFNAAGLGGVILYSSTSIENKYDDMAGIHLSTPI